jgi:hypothetical protein
MAWDIVPLARNDILSATFVDRRPASLVYEYGSVHYGEGSSARCLSRGVPAARYSSPVSFARPRPPQWPSGLPSA